MAKGNPQRELVEPGIYKRINADGSSVFEISWREHGRQRLRVVRGGGIMAARKALRAAHAARDRGEPAAADPRLTFNRAADEWWDMRAVRLRKGTRDAYKGHLNHLRKRFGTSRLSDITPKAVAEFVTVQQQSFKGWTIKGELNVLSAVYRHASRHMGFTGRNPVALLDSVERPSTEDERPKRTLNQDELSRLIAGVDDHYRLAFEFAAATGARLGETLGVVWEGIDLDNATVTFTHQLSRNGVRVPLKTKRSRRCIEISHELAARLRAHKLEAKQSGPHDLVFASRKGTPHDHRNIGGRVLARAVKRAGLEAVERNGEVVVPAPTFHSLRHSHGSALIAAGWDIEEVSARLGHADVATTMRVYVHEYDAARRSAQRRDRLPKLYAATEGKVVALPK